MTGTDDCMNCGEPTTVTKGFDRLGPDGTDQCSQADFHAVVRLPAVWADMADDVLELLRGAA